MARDKLYEARMQGMIHAANIVKEGGLEALENDIKMRNIYSVPLNISESQFRDLTKTIGQGSKAMIFTILFTVLDEDFEFKEEDMKKFADMFNKRFNDAMEMDFMGEHYVTFADYAELLQEKYGDLMVDIERVRTEETGFDEHNPKFRNTRWIKGVIATLRLHGYEDAAVFFEKRLEEHKV